MGVVEDIAGGAGNLRFTSQAGKIGLSVANGSPPLFGAVSPRR